MYGLLTSNVFKKTAQVGIKFRYTSRGLTPEQILRRMKTLNFENFSKEITENLIEEFIKSVKIVNDKINELLDNRYLADDMKPESFKNGNYSTYYYRKRGFTYVVIIDRSTIA